MKRLKITAAALVLVVAGIAAWWFHHSGTASNVSGEKSQSVPERSSSTPVRSGTREAAAVPGASPNAAGRMQEILAELGAAKDAETSRRLLAELRKFLDQLAASVASREVVAFLASGQDAPTRLDVTVKPGGALGDCSSMRVFLMDYLGQIDRAAAGRLARETLSAPTTPDEWAVGLRNLAWSDNSPATAEYLRSKARELLQNKAWQQNPTSGYLEAFDAIVYAQAYDLAPQLTALVREKDQRALAHAAYLTLDRLTLSDPAAALAPLAAQPELMEGREQTRANFFARADVRDPKQKTLLEGYLLDAGRSAEELRTFAGLYPNANFMISNNLLTATPTPGYDDLAGRDQEALRVVNEWSADPRFSKLKPLLDSMRARLDEFLRQRTVH